MKKLTELLNEEKDVYVKLKDEKTAEEFLKTAEEEGFLFYDGAKPTSRKKSDLYALKKDKTLCFVGFAGHMRVQCHDENLLVIKY